MKTFRIKNEFESNREQLDFFVENFKTEGQPFGNQKRNSLKLFDLNGLQVNIKSFRVPNLANQLAYRFFRKSKAQRSFEYGLKLQGLGIGTPEPVAYYEYSNLILFKNSYYISRQLDCDLTYRELIKDFNYPDRENILRAFTRFTYKLHENNVNFLDHSPGNTLIVKSKDDYNFYLVDLNRMKFETMDLHVRLKNFAKLTKHKSMVEIMSDEYAKCLNKNSDEVFELMWHYTKEFRKRYERRRDLKKSFKFWK
jgi:Lipopolysaccharide kinase (Kdo/WaaP) family